MSEARTRRIVPSGEELAGTEVHAPTWMRTAVTHVGRAVSHEADLLQAGLDALARVLIAARRMAADGPCADGRPRECEVATAGGDALHVHLQDTERLLAVRVRFTGRSADGAVWEMWFHGTEVSAIQVRPGGDDDATTTRSPSDLLARVAAAYPGAVGGPDIGYDLRTDVVARVGREALATDGASPVRFWPLTPEGAVFPPVVRCEPIVRVVDGPERWRGTEARWDDHLARLGAELGERAASQAGTMRPAFAALRAQLRSETGRDDELIVPVADAGSGPGWTVDVTAPIPTTHPARRVLAGIGDAAVEIGWRIAAASSDEEGTR